MESHHLYYDKQKNILVWKLQSRYKLTYCVKVLWSGSLCYISNILYFTVRYVFFIYSLITRAVSCDSDCYDAKYNISLQWIFASQLLEKGNDIQWFFGMMMIYLKDKSRKYPFFFSLFFTIKLKLPVNLIWGKCVVIHTVTDLFYHSSYFWADSFAAGIGEQFMWFWSICHMIQHFSGKQNHILHHNNISELWQ